MLGKMTARMTIPRSAGSRFRVASSNNSNGTFRRAQQALASWSTTSVAPLPLRTLSSEALPPKEEDPQEVDVQKGLTPWKYPMVECRGDYTKEAWLEEHIGGPLYQYQSSLPKLPVSSIQDTLERFLPTALPLARTEQEAQNLLQAVEKFPSQAASLQERLLQRQQEWSSNSSWLQHWWNTAGYLDVRDPVVINVSYFFHLSDDPAVALDETPNVRRGAALLKAAWGFRNEVCSGTLPAEQIGRGDKKKPICSTAYKYMFHACRIPEETSDSYRIYDPSRQSHAIVVRQGHFFAVEVCNPSTGEAHPLPVLEESIRQCLVQAQDLQARGVPKLGILTSSNRTDWAKARQALVQYGGAEMESALGKLESGLLLLCLDDEDPVSRQECAELFLYGGQASSGENRWFDKSIQLIVTNNGKAGLLGEHSMMDGMPVVGLANRLVVETYDKCAADSSSVPAQPKVTPIFGETLHPAMNQASGLVNKAKQDLQDLVSKHDLHVQSFQGYGSNFIKKAGFSPDAYVQMAMQLATYRLWGEQGGTYEATQVRPFLHGRTETTRTVSKESAALVHRFGLRPKHDEHVEEARKEKLGLLHDATAAHIQYIGKAAKGQGVDRHFFGLSMLVGPNEKAPDLFSDPVYARSKRWRVSTSHLTHPKFDGWGYGEVVPDGVGLAYSIHPRHCVFNVMALKEHGWTDKLCELLEEALLEMRALIEMDKTPVSKL